MTKEEKRWYDKARRERNRDALKAQRRAYYLRTRVRKYPTDNWRKLPEVRDRVSAALKGKKLTPEWIANRSAARIRNAKGISETTREKLKERMKGKAFPRHGIEKSIAARKGKPLSAEHRAKLVEAAARYPANVKMAQRMVTILRKEISEKQD